MNFEELKYLRSSLLEKERPDDTCIKVCGGTGCNAQGSQAVVEAFARELSRTGLDEKVSLRTTGCHGFCERGPVVVILPRGIFYPQITPEDVPEIVEKTIKQGEIVDRIVYIDPGTGSKIIYDADVPFYSKQKRIVLRDNGRLDPTDIYDYIRHDGYQALGKVLESMTPEQVIEDVLASGLRGRGGAGFPTGKKWSLARSARGDQKYMVCNGDEGDPGAFMDRSIMEGNPHLVLEGLAIGAYAIGASVAYIYVRAEYPLAVINLKRAVHAAGEMKLLGHNILGSGFDLEVRIIEGAGAFVCGEETALMASIEGKIGRPRPRPPFPAQSGLWGKPTNINNVETLASVPPIINYGSEWYAGLGTEKSKGTKIFSLAGTVNNTGLVEVPMGMALGELVYDIGGGIPRGRKFKAAQVGGPSGCCLPASTLGLPIDYESLSAIGAIMGSGGLVVMDESACMVDIARFFLSFTQSESCGKCTPCRLGTKRMLEILTRITRGQGKPEDIDLLVELAEMVKDSSLCGLGQNAPNPVLSTIKYFREEYEVHIREKRCPAATCEALVYAPCEHTCPLNVDAAGYVALISQGRFEEALELERQRNPLAAICGRVCHHPCEGRCKRGDLDQPVAIASLKRAAAEYGAAAGKPSRIKTAGKRTEKVAIIGSGPAGLNAAYHLARWGYPVTIFEALPVPGGMLTVGIPDFRLPRHVLDADIEFITSLGVEIKLNSPLGECLTIDDLENQGYKAILLATGAHLGQKLGIEGDGLEGVHDGVSFLRRINLGEPVKAGSRVAIVGGGNVAFDAARTSLRLGAEEVTVVYRRAREDMPAAMEEIHEAEEEGITVLPMTNPLRINGAAGRVSGLVCLKTEPGEYDSSGRRKPKTIPGSEFTLEVDTVIAAIGQVPDTGFTGKTSGLAVQRNGTMAVDAETLATGRAGIFAAGDNVTGPATVVEAMAGGEQAAISIDRYIRGVDLAGNRAIELKTPQDIPWDEHEMETGPRMQMPAAPQVRRKTSFDEVNLGYSRETAVKEARRCLRCDLKR